MKALGTVFISFVFLSIAADESKLPVLAPSVRSMVPLGGRRGETATVQIRGRHLNNALDLTFARDDIKAQILASDFFTLKARIEVGPNVPVGLHDFRLRTPSGSHVGVFHVGSLPRVDEIEPNNDLAHAQSITMPVLIDGVVDEADYDLFRFHAEAGQTVILDLMSTRAGGRLDGTLAVLDPRGNELDFVDDYYIHHDPYLAFTARDTADYYVRVAGSHEQGSPDSGYRLVIAAAPHALRVLPVGARRGASGVFTVAGHNLNNVDQISLGGSKLNAQIISAAESLLTFRATVPATMPRGAYSLHLRAGTVEDPVPALMLVSDIEEKLSVPARSRSNPQMVNSPVGLSGVLNRRRAADFFSFEARAGERLAFEVDSMKLGFLLDPAIGIFDMEGREIAFQDEPALQNGKEPPMLDPYLVHTFEKGGRYIAMIRDSAERGDPNYVYHLSIRPVTPDFELRALSPEQTFYRGRPGSVLVRVRRLGGWDTPVEVWAEGLPKGITAEKKIAEPKNTPTKDTCGADLWLDGTNLEIPVHVSPDAAPGFFPIRLRARGSFQGTVVEHSAVMFYRWGSVGKITGPVGDQTFLAAVTDLPPVLLEGPEKFALTPGKEARLRVLVSRFDDAKAALPIAPALPLPGVQFENGVIAPGANQVELRVTVSNLFKPGSFQLRAGTAVSPPIELSVTGAEEEKQ